MLCALGAYAQCTAPPRRLHAGARALHAAATDEGLECSSALDLVYVLDASGSITAPFFNVALHFINATLETFDFDNSRVSPRQ